MKLIQTILNNISSKNKDFTKRLILKRKSLAQDKSSFMIENSKKTESTIVHILKIYNEPYIYNSYSMSSWYERFEKFILDNMEKEQKNQLELDRINGHIRMVEYRLTKDPYISSKTPIFSNTIEYIRYRLKIEHPGDNKLTPEHGYTDEFFRYAIDESRFIFRN